MTDRVEQLLALDRLLERAKHLRGGYGPPSKWFGVSVRSDDLLALTDLCESLILALSDDEVSRLCEMRGEDPGEVADRTRRVVKEALEGRTD